MREKWSWGSGLLVACSSFGEDVRSAERAGAAVMHPLAQTFRVKNVFADV